MDQRPLFFHGPHEEYGSHAEDRRSIFVIKRLSAFWRAGPKYRKPGDLVFANAKGEPANRRNLLRRYLPPGWILIARGGDLNLAGKLKC